MLFTLELTEIGAACFRLQKDGIWRNCGKDLKLKETDYVTSDPGEITRKSPGGTIVLDGKTYDVDPHEWPTEHDQLHGSSSVFRKNFPQEPTIEQLRHTIAQGDDNHINCLILNVDGLFELRQAPPFNQLLNAPSIVVRHESFARGNGYVGPEAAAHDSLMNDLFVSSLEFWKDHLLDHSTQEYSDMHAVETLDKIRKELDNIRANWIPDY